MRPLFLPGNSPANGPWIDEVARAFAPLWGPGHVQRYRHWEDPAPDARIDFAAELDRLPPRASVIFAKSAGALLTLQAWATGRLATERAVLVGVPVRFARAAELPIEDWLRRLPCPCLVLQQEADPALPAAALGPLVTTPGTVVAVPGDDHHYADVARLLREVERWTPV